MNLCTIIIIRTSTQCIFIIINTYLSSSRDKGELEDLREKITWITLLFLHLEQFLCLSACGVEQNKCSITGFGTCTCASLVCSLFPVPSPCSALIPLAYIKLLEWGGCQEICIKKILSPPTASTRLATETPLLPNSAQPACSDLSIAIISLLDQAIRVLDSL